MNASNDDTPIWFMDVDGVLNMFPEDHVSAHLAGARTFRAGPNLFPKMTRQDRMDALLKWGGTDRCQITYDPEIIDRIREMHTSGKVRIMWLTTWGSGANGELRAGLKFPYFKSAGEPHRNSSGHLHTTDDGIWWKWVALEDFLATYPANSRFIWTDDDLVIEPEAWQWALDRGALAICPDYTTGLTNADLDKVEAYLAGQDVHLSVDSVR